MRRDPVVMLRVALILAAVSAVLAAPVAQAATLTGDAASWARSVKMHVPGPAGPPIDVQFGPCPGLKDTATTHIPECAIPELDEIYIRTRGDRFVLAHAFGHFFDARNLDANERAYLAPLLGGGGWDACGSPADDIADYGDCPKEQFADAYAACALGLKPDTRDRHGRLIVRDWTTMYGWTPTPRKNARVCSLIRIYSDPA